MVQNHLLQLLCLVAMEPPTDLSADCDARRESEGHPLAAPNVARGCRRERRARRNTPPGAIDGKDVPGYRAGGSREPAVDDRDLRRAESARGQLALGGRAVSTSAWASAWRKAAREIAVQFKDAPSVLFNRDAEPLGPNVLVIRIQPDEGISLRMQCKAPRRERCSIEPVKMDFHLRHQLRQSQPEAYERLLLDAMSGDATLFARRDEVEDAWRSSTRSSTPGTRTRTRRRSASIPPAPGDRRKPTTSSNATAARGGECSDADSTPPRSARPSRSANRRTEEALGAAAARPRALR